MGVVTTIPGGIVTLMRRFSGQTLRNFGKGRRTFPEYTIYMLKDGEVYWGTSTVKKDHPDIFKDINREQADDKVYPGFPWIEIITKYRSGYTPKQLSHEYGFNKEQLYYHNARLKRLGIEINSIDTTDAELVP